MTSFYYNVQNPSFCCFLVQIRAIVFLNIGEIDKFKLLSEDEMNSGSCSRMSSS